MPTFKDEELATTEAIKVSLRWSQSNVKQSADHHCYSPAFGAAAK
jgi:hypothetical protein